MNRVFWGMVVSMVSITMVSTCNAMLKRDYRMLERDYRMKQQSARLFLDVFKKPVIRFDEANFALFCFMTTWGIDPRTEVGEEKCRKVLGAVVREIRGNKPLVVVLKSK